MVREAGGIVKNYEGEDYILGNDGIIVTNRHLSQELLNRIV